MAVDSAPVTSIMKNDGGGGDTNLQAGDFDDEQVEIITYTDTGGHFLWTGGGRGNAARYNVQSGMAFHIPLQGVDGRLSRLALPDDVAYEDGATFTGQVSGPTPTANEHLATKLYVDLGGANPSDYAPIDDIRVSGTNIVSLTTGRSLTVIPHGLLLSFKPVNTNSSAMRLEIDGLPNNAFVKSDGAGGSTEFVGGDIRSGRSCFCLL